MEIDRSATTHQRIDVWLWTTRMFKTRNLATQACRGGHVQLDGQRVKASQKVSIGQEVRVRKAGAEHIRRITGFVPTRPQASIAVQCYEDLTPAPDPALRGFVPRRDKGTGRPTKKDRREMERFLGDMAKPPRRS
ncbi:heat shock protein Hsp15 [Brevibacterium sanguinis]|uniref:Heat shock protein Hsp15 n=2 Tax=Brevibacterium TaxID=1696 RepID=A0A366IRE6_9MICO|nr:MULTISPECIES: S4 domain-containing protein [Brevibacterium]RBP67896.1 heat shock protein Hsp15 [Brevibacterium sanguinis]RBP74687.1 heat shock protein Hsp15 [Brevibacterium celere]